jgi:hypothetical protein
MYMSIPLLCYLILRYTAKVILFMREYGSHKYILLITAQCFKVRILTVTLNLINRIPDASMTRQPRANEITTIRSQSRLILASFNIPEERFKKIIRAGIRQKLES